MNGVTSPRYGNLPTSPRSVVSPTSSNTNGVPRLDLSSSLNSSHTSDAFSRDSPHSRYLAATSPRSELDVNGDVYDDVFVPKPDGNPSEAQTRVARVGVRVIGGPVTSPTRKTTTIVEEEDPYRKINRKPDSDKAGGLLRVPLDVSSDEYVTYVNTYQINRAQRSNSRKTEHKPKAVSTPKPFEPISDYEELPADKMAKEKRAPARPANGDAPDVPSRGSIYFLCNKTILPYSVIAIHAKLKEFF